MVQRGFACYGICYCKQEGNKVYDSILGCWINLSWLCYTLDDYTLPGAPILFFCSLFLKNHFVIIERSSLKAICWYSSCYFVDLKTNVIDKSTLDWCDIILGKCHVLKIDIDISSSCQEPHNVPCKIFLNVNKISLSIDFLLNRTQHILLLTTFHVMFVFIRCGKGNSNMIKVLQ